MKRQNLRTVSLIVVTFTYLLFGAAIFGWLESEAELKQREALELIERIVRKKYNISEDDYTVLTTTVIKLVPHKAGIQWKFPGAFYFATTVVTTIGYGHSTPSTPSGRSFCMLYALIGIPLGLVMFQSIGERLNTFVGAVLRQWKRCIKAKNPEVTVTNLVAVVSVLSTLLMTSMAAVFARYERWDYFDALYYCFITLTTIGFGDYVALQKDSALQSKPEYVCLSLIFILFGLSVVSSAVNLLVLKFLTLNTEDERRDEQMRNTAAMNPIQLEGDVITSPAGKFEYVGGPKRHPPALTMSQAMAYSAIKRDRESLLAASWQRPNKQFQVRLKRHNQHQQQVPTPLSPQLPPSPSSLPLLALPESQHYQVPLPPEPPPVVTPSEQELALGVGHQPGDSQVEHEDEEQANEVPFSRHRRRRPLMTTTTSNGSSRCSGSSLIDRRDDDSDGSIYFNRPTGAAGVVHGGHPRHRHHDDDDDTVEHWHTAHGDNSDASDYDKDNDRRRHHHQQQQHHRAATTRPPPDDCGAFGDEGIRGGQRLVVCTAPGCDHSHGDDDELDYDDELDDNGELPPAPVVDDHDDYDQDDDELFEYYLHDHEQQGAPFEVTADSACFHCGHHHYRQHQHHHPHPQHYQHNRHSRSGRSHCRQHHELDGLSGSGALGAEAAGSPPNSARISNSEQETAIISPTPPLPFQQSAASPTEAPLVRHQQWANNNSLSLCHSQQQPERFRRQQSEFAFCLPTTTHTVTANYHRTEPAAAVTPTTTATTTTTTTTTASTRLDQLDSLSMGSSGAGGGGSGPPTCPHGTGSQWLAKQETGRSHEPTRILRDRTMSSSSLGSPMKQLQPTTKPTMSTMMAVPDDDALGLTGAGGASCVAPASSDTDSLRTVQGHHRHRKHAAADGHSCQAKHCQVDDEPHYYQKHRNNQRQRTTTAADISHHQEQQQLRGHQVSQDAPGLGVARRPQRRRGPTNRMIDRDGQQQAISQESAAAARLTPTIANQSSCSCSWASLRLAYGSPTPVGPSTATSRHQPNNTPTFYSVDKPTTTPTTTTQAHSSSASCLVLDPESLELQSVDRPVEQKESDPCVQYRPVHQLTSFGAGPNRMRAPARLANVSPTQAPSAGSVTVYTAAFQSAPDVHGSATRLPPLQPATLGSLDRGTGAAQLAPSLTGAGEQRKTCATPMISTRPAPITLPRRSDTEEEDDRDYVGRLQSRGHQPDNGSTSLCSPPTGSTNNNNNHAERDLVGRERGTGGGSSRSMALYRMQSDDSVNDQIQLDGRPRRPSTQQHATKQGDRRPPLVTSTSTAATSNTVGPAGERRRRRSSGSSSGQQLQKQAKQVNKLICKCCCQHAECIEYALGSASSKHQQRQKQQARSMGLPQAGPRSPPVGAEAGRGEAGVELAVDTTTTTSISSGVGQGATSSEAASTSKKTKTSTFQTSSGPQPALANCDKTRPVEVGTTTSLEPTAAQPNCRIDRAGNDATDKSSASVSVRDNTTSPTKATTSDGPPKAPAPLASEQDQLDNNNEEHNSYSQLERNRERNNK